MKERKEKEHEELEELVGLEEPTAEVLGTEEDADARADRVEKLVDQLREELNEYDEFLLAVRFNYQGDHEETFKTNTAIGGTAISSGFKAIVEAVKSTLQVF